MSRELNLPVFDAAQTEFLAGPQIAEATLLAIEESRERIWGCFFLASVAVAHDPHRLVRNLCEALVRAHQRGVDVRLLLDDFESSTDGLPTNEVTGHFLSRRGVAVRLYESDRHNSTHSKYFLFDDVMRHHKSRWKLLGSFTISFHCSAHPATSSVGRAPSVAALCRDLRTPSSLYRATTSL